MFATLTYEFKFSNAGGSPTFDGVSTGAELAYISYVTSMSNVKLVVADNGRVGIGGVTVPDTDLHVYNTFKAGGKATLGGVDNTASLTEKITYSSSASSTLTVTASHNIIVAAANDITVLLPSSPADGRIIKVKAVPGVTGTVIDGNGKNIDGAATITLAATDCYVIFYSSSAGQWLIESFFDSGLI